MARRTQGFALREHPKGIWYVRFSHQGKRYDQSTGTRVRTEAFSVAQKIYAEAISGRVRRQAQPVSAKVGLIEVGAKWLAAISTSLDELTVAQYLLYVRTHFAPYFGSLNSVTTASAESYARMRLGNVMRRTVLKELSALRGLLNWCHAEGYLSEVPNIKAPQSKATGTTVHRRKVTELSPAIVERFLKVVRGSARQYFAFMYETALRPETIVSLRVPEHYTRGSSVLHITDPIDKARFGRDLPLTPKARAILAEVAPESGRIFAKHDYRFAIERACETLGVPRFTPYDLRHARATHLMETSNNLAGVAYLLGHKRTGTTSARYVHPSLRAAKDVLG